MFISTFDIFKVSVGPSSSHTMGPMIAANRFMKKLCELGAVEPSIKVTLRGSLAFTGKGHGTDTAVILGLSGIEPSSMEMGYARSVFETCSKDKMLPTKPFGQLRFDPDTDLIFDYDNNPQPHPNGLTMEAYSEGGDLIVAQNYFSIGGGFVVTDTEFKDLASRELGKIANVPFPFSNARQMLEMCDATGLSIAKLKMENECNLRPEDQVLSGINNICLVMQKSIDEGLSSEGALPGGLNVQRRAKALHSKLRKLEAENKLRPENHTDWLIAYAMAVNEQNAGGNKIVTAPTNGAAGVIPAVYRYWENHMTKDTGYTKYDFFLTAAAIGGLIKHNASISGAECGCQAEIGSASAMAAAGLTAVRGGSPQQIENAAEIALEHHLGLTCDPVLGLVQVPCIERNGLGATKALSASSLALHGDGSHLVHLDDVIRTMWQTGQDMHESYKETSLGGLAVNIPNC